MGESMMDMQRYADDFNKGQKAKKETEAAALAKTSQYREVNPKSIGAGEKEVTLELDTDAEWWKKGAAKPAAKPARPQQPGARRAA